MLSFNTTGMYIVYQMLNVLLCVNEFILSFLLLCSVLVYHRYTNDNIGPWWEETQLEYIF